MGMMMMIEIILLVQFCTNIAIAHKCTYQVPTIDEIVHDVPLEIDQPLHYHRHSHHRSKREDNYRPLRIHAHLDSSIFNLSIDEQHFINTSVLPDAVDNYWSQMLMVRRSSAPLRLSRKCLQSRYYKRVGDRIVSCSIGCRNVTTCGESIVPDEHLYQCHYCLSANPLTCSTSGVSDGVGVHNADFVLYVSTVHTDRCDNRDTIAYAAHCQQEADFDRPIAGHVNICPDALSINNRNYETLISTVKHEILHALGFSAGLYAFFRDSHGRPRTQRNIYNKPMTLNKQRGIYDWDETTIKTVNRKDWWSRDSITSRTMHIMVTPRVREAVRRHFECELMEGAELEDQGGDGTALTHWEKRLFENEAMTGTHTQNPIYSNITLALMEDTGWYLANYHKAEHLLWGKSLGCDFAMRSCGDWIRLRKLRGESIAPYCDEIKDNGAITFGRTRCNQNRDSLALCNLIRYKSRLASNYHNFNQLDNVNNSDELSYYGGAVELADYCPYNQEFEWKSLHMQRRDSQCSNELNTPDDDDNASLESYGNSSRCFQLDGKWTQRKCGRTKSYPQHGAGCYQFSCINGRINVDMLQTGGAIYTCHYDGQPIVIRRIIAGWLHEGTIICPSCRELCDGDGFVCSDDDISMSRLSFVGDPILAEPCRAAPGPYHNYYLNTIGLIFIIIIIR